MRVPDKHVVAVDGVTLDVARGETLGIVGESGSGKSTLARCLVRLHELNSGHIVFDGIDVGSARREDLRVLRRRIQMVFQDPYSSLNPQLSIKSALAEAGRVNGRVDRKNSTPFVHRLLEMVGLPATIASRTPRQLSGGQRQRVAIARALAVEPQVLIGDEAVSSLDVSVQAQILNLIQDLKDQLHLTVIFISHQLSVISHISDNVAIMYLGRVVEYGPASQLFLYPQHPYTRGLLDAHPEPDPARRHTQPAIRGELPSALEMPSGCRFRTRCPFAEDVCREVEPVLAAVTTGHLVACHVLPYAPPFAGMSRSNLRG